MRWSSISISYAVFEYSNISFLTILRNINYRYFETGQQPGVQKITFRTQKGFSISHRSPD